MTDIVHTDGVLGGKPRLKGHRISVLQIADMVLDAGHSPEYVADQLGISLSDVHTALAYYYDNPDEMDEIRDRNEQLENRLREQAITPDHVEQ
ncbi:DUF433 domain-containing protein [Halosimplex pelagicum]|uniref:DUF433 domain-containing protein n=1 Tax=Halosimplex pelagicum TaxID=869886 RepID=A0A7D5P5F2_9EURY|nr:DUF433 domain-containing protein [Halosimplex pelagicum]QLH81223.1 DUF433 domain-containing protein [Halosimplex pelagicum]